MITQLAVVSVYVRNQEAALDFYVNKLGFEKRADMPFGDGLRWLEVAPPGGQTRIVLEPDFSGTLSSRIGQHAGIVFAADDIQATYQTLRDRGVEFTEVPARQPWGMMQAQFVDQDGNGFVLVEVAGA